MTWKIPPHHIWWENISYKKEVTGNLFFNEYSHFNNNGNQIVKSNRKSGYYLLVLGWKSHGSLGFGVSGGSSFGRHLGRASIWNKAWEMRWQYGLGVNSLYKVCIPKDGWNVNALVESHRRRDNKGLSHRSVSSLGELVLCGSLGLGWGPQLFITWILEKRISP